MFRRLIPTYALRRAMLLSSLVAIYSGLAVWKEQGPYSRFADFPPGLEAALTLALGLLLALRVNRAFDRWWEGRILWGTLVNACRNLAVKANNVVVKHDSSFDRLHRLVVAFPFSLRDHLRGVTGASRIPDMSGEHFSGQHMPSWIVNQIYGIFEVWKREERIQYGEFRMLDRESKVLLEVCGGCERIKNTPIAVSYRVLLLHALALFLLTLPWGLVDQFGVWTILIVFLTSYLVLAAEIVAEHIEQPFEAVGDNLDLDGICETIERTVDEILTTKTVSQLMSERIPDTDSAG